MTLIIDWGDMEKY